MAQLRKEHELVLANFERFSRKGRLSADLIARAQSVDWKLHNTLIDFLGNAIISSAYRVNLLKLRIFRREQTRLDEAQVIPTMREHLAVLEGLATRDPRKAADAIAAHILRARDRALGLHNAATVDRTPARSSRSKG